MNDEDMDARLVYVKDHPKKIKEIGTWIKET